MNSSKHVHTRTSAYREFYFYFFWIYWNPFLIFCRPSFTKFLLLLIFSGGLFIMQEGYAWISSASHYFFCCHSLSIYLRQKIIKSCHNIVEKFKKIINPVITYTWRIFSSNKIKYEISPGSFCWFRLDFSFW